MHERAFRARGGERADWGRAVVLAAAVATLLACACASAAFARDARAQSPKKRVLVLHSYHKGLTWTDGESRGIREVLDARDDVDPFFEYLDSKRIPFEHMADPFAAFLAAKYATTSFDAVIAGDNNALAFLGERRATLFPGVPVVFCGINNFTPDMLRAFDGRATGVVQALDPGGTIDLILRLQPGLRTLAIVSGTTPTARAIRDEVRAALDGRGRGHGVRVQWLDGLGSETLRARLAGLGAGDAVLLCNFNRDANGVYYSHEEGARMVSRASNAPVYAMEDQYLGTGVLGGNMLAAEDQGRAAARLCLEVLDTGRLPAVVPDSPNHAMFDYQVVERFGLDGERIPAKAVVINRPESFYHRYKAQIRNAALAASFLLLAFLGVCYGLVRSRRAERRLRESLDLLDATQSLAHVGGWEWDVRRRSMTWTAETFRIHDLDPDEIPNGSPELVERSLACYDPEDRPVILAAFRRCVEEGVSYERLFPLTTARGRRIWVHTTARAEMRDGRVAKVFGNIADVTERTQAAEELRRLRNYLANIIDSMPSVLMGVDSDGRVTQWNMEAERLTSLAPGDAVGHPLDAVFPRLAGEMERVREAMRERKACSHCMRHRGEDGQTRYEDVTIYPLVANGVDGAVVRIDDVTDRVNLERVMVQSEKMMSVGGLAAGMAHEINNPLAGILGYVQNIRNRIFGGLAKNEAVAEECGVSLAGVRDYLERRDIPRMLEGIHESGNRAAAIVSNMLSFSRKSEKRHGRHDLAKLLDVTIDLAGNDYDLKKYYDFRKIEIVREYESGMPPVFCEGNEMQQVFLNLLKNGAEAMTDKEYVDDAPRFVCRVRREADMAVVEIEDNGPGIDEEGRKRVFEPFYTTKEVGRGTGLGLSVSYFIVTDQHGGRMEADSSPGQWTRFTIRLPLGEEADDAAHDPDS